MRKMMGFTQNQMLVLVGLMATIIVIFGIAIVYFMSQTIQPIKITSPINIIISPTNAIVSPANLLPTNTLIPTYVYRPTFTPIPSATPFVFKLMNSPTANPYQAQANPTSANPASVNPPAANPVPDCSAALNYADAMHKYYLDSIDYIHGPMIGYYQSLIDQAARSRDALSLAQAQQGLANEQAQVKAEKASENKRYKAERASITANCH